MQRKSTFEDFEKLMDTAASDSSENIEHAPEEDSSEIKHGKLEFDARIAQRRHKPRIPANGSELFDESDSEEEAYEEVYEPRKPV